MIKHIIVLKYETEMGREKVSVTDRGIGQQARAGLG